MKSLAELGQAREKKKQRLIPSGKKDVLNWKAARSAAESRLRVGRIEATPVNKSRSVLRII